MFFFMHKISTLLIIVASLIACGGGINDVENTHPSQFAPKTAPDVTVKRNEKNQLIVDWHEQQNSQKYIVYISDTANFESSQTTMVEVNKPPYIVDSLNGGTSYHIKIIPSWENKIGPESSAVELIAPPIPPGDISVENLSTITWENDSPSFNVYWSKNRTFTISQAEGSAKGITIQSFQPKVDGYEDDETIYFIVTAVNNNTESEISNKVEILASNILNRTLSAPTNPKIIVTDGSFTMDWSQVTNANKYSVYMAQDSGVTQENAGTLTGGMIHTNVESSFGHSLTNGSRFYLVVTANNDNEESVESTKLSVKPKATGEDIPDEVSITADKDHVTISWKAVENATSYNVYWSNSPNLTAQSGKLVPGGSDTTSTNITHTGLQNGLMYYYIVTAIFNNGEGEESAEVGAVPYGQLPPPSGITTQETNKQITIHWPEVPGAVKYHLYMAFEDSINKNNVNSLDGSMKHTDIISSPFVHHGLVNNSVYYMRLTAIDQFGEVGAESEVFSATPHQTPGGPEIANPIADQKTNEDELYNFQFFDSTFLDPDGDELTYTANEHGTNSLPDWLSFDPISRTFSGTPENVNVGILEIEIITSDDSNSATDTFILEVVNTNDAPTLNKSITSQTVFAGNVLIFEISEDTFIDEDIGDTLTFGAKIGGADLPDWIIFDSSTRKFTFSPRISDVGVTLAIDVTAIDENSESISTSFELRIIESRSTPFATDDTPKGVNENETIIIDVLKNDVLANTGAPIALNKVTVIDGSSFGITTEITTDGTILYKHNGTENFTDSFTYTIEDEDGIVSNVATVNINIIPVNDPPVITGTPNTSVEVGSSYSFIPTVKDPDNSPSELTFSINKQPDWTSFNEDTGELSGTAPASAYGITISDIKISVTDGSLSDTLLPAFDITVTGTPPVANNDSVEIISAGNSTIIDVINNDEAVEGALNLSSIVITSNGSKGIATPNTDGTITYQSNVITSANDSFTYTVENSSGLKSNEATVNITVTPWLSEDIGDVGLTGSFVQTSDTSFEVSGSGTDIWGTADAFHYAYKSISGDIDMIIQVTGIINPLKWTKAALMVRESLNPDAKHVSLIVTDITQIPQHSRGVHLQSRQKDSELTIDYTNRLNNTDIPRYIRLIRRGNTFDTFESSNGESWQLVGTTYTPMNTDVLVGMAITSHTDGILSTAIFDNLKLLNKTINLPTPSVKSISSFPFTITEQFSNSDTQYYQINGLTAGNTYTVYINSDDGDDINLMVYGDNFNNLECHSFQSAVSYDACLATANDSGELYIRVDGTYANQAQGKSFTLSLTQWSGQDIGTSTLGGHEEIHAEYPSLDGITGSQPANDGYSVTGSGKDIFGTSDGFHFFSQPITGDAEIIARVSSQINTDDWAKAGVMIREINSASSKFVDVVVTPANGVRFQSRIISDTGSVNHNNTRTNGISVPRWVRLVRRGDTFDAYESSDNINWLFIGSTYVPMSPEVNIGLAVTAHDLADTTLSTALFENVKVFNKSGFAPNVNSFAGLISSQSFNVDTTDIFVKITDLNPTTSHSVTMNNLTDDADLYVYSSSEFSNLLCPVVTSVNPDNETGTTIETCTINSNIDGELFIRINGSYTTSGTTFDLTVSQP